MNKTKAQAAFEYAIILAIVVTALTGMQVYFKRGIQAGIKICSDELGGQKEGLVTEGIEHGIISQASVQHTSTNSVQTEQIAKGEARQIDITDVSTRTGTTVSTPFSLQPVSQAQPTAVLANPVINISNLDPDPVINISNLDPDPVDPIIPEDPVVFDPDPDLPVVFDPDPKDSRIIDLPIRIR